MRGIVILSILASCALALLATRPGTSTMAATNMDAKAAYLVNCSGCHGATGQGIAGLAPPLAKDPYVTGNQRSLIRLMLAGAAGPREARGTTWYGSMPAWKDVLSSQQIADVINYMRASWGNRATPVTRAQVEAVAMTLNPPAPSGATAAGAAELYVINCSGCHGAKGQGAVNIAPPLAQNPDVTGDPQKVISAVADGSAGPITERGVTWNGAMPPWRATFTDKGLAAIITYIRSSWGNHAPPVTQEQISTQK